MRQRIIALVLFAGTAFTGQGWSVLQASQSRSLVSANPFQTPPTNEINVDVQERSDGSLSVTLRGQSTRVGTSISRPLANRATQVWILLGDGTNLAQTRKPAVAGVGNAGSATDLMIFQFERPATNNLAAVVVSVDGNIAVVPIKAK